MRCSPKKEMLLHFSGNASFHTKSNRNYFFHDILPHNNVYIYFLKEMFPIPGEIVHSYLQLLAEVKSIPREMHEVTVDVLFNMTSLMQVF